MIDARNKNLCVLPVLDGGVTKEFSSSHNGTDWGWVDVANADVYAIQDGIVREAGYEGVNSGIGYYVTLEHQFSDGTKRFSGYIHLKNQPVVKVGQEVKAGDKLGVRGGSPYQANGAQLYATHLHLYTTKVVTVNYSWNNMRNNVINPFSELTFTRMKGKKYNLAKMDGHNFGETTKYYEDLLYVDEHIGEIEKLKSEVATLTNKINELNTTISLQVKELDEATSNNYSLRDNLKALEGNLNRETQSHILTKKSLQEAQNKMSQAINILK